MRLNVKLCQQHLGWTFKRHWQVQGKRVVRDTGAGAELEKLGIQVKGVKEVLYPKKHMERIEIIGNKPVAILEDETHPNWHEKPCCMYGDNDLLLEGITQAQVLTKTIEIRNFPKNIEESIISARLPASIDSNVQQLIMASHIYDAEQVKLPKVKLADRPAYISPNSYGISQQRRIRLLTNKLINECEKWSTRGITSDRWLFDDIKCKITLPKDDEILQFGVRVEKLIASKKPLEPVKSQYTGEIPELYPLKSTISMPRNQIYTTSIDYPLPMEVKTLHPHTIIAHFINGEVKNLHETDVTDKQWQSRTLLKAFAVAATRAKQLYGNDVVMDKLPKPVMVQSIQTDGRVFHFGAFQLNTLNLDGSDGLKNYWFHEPHMELFGVCDYVKGKPTLEAYNKDVFRIFNAFYNSQIV